MKDALRSTKKKHTFDTFHIDEQHRLMAPIHTPLPRLTQIPSVCRHFHNGEWSCPHKNFAIEKMVGGSGIGNKKIAAVDDEAVAEEAPLGGRDGVAQRFLVLRLVCVLFSLVLTSLDLRVMIKSGARSCRDAVQRLGCHRAVQFSRQSSQTSAGVWYRARPQQRPEADDGGTLASKAGDMCRNPCFSLPFLFCGPPSGEESAPDSTEQAAAPGVMYIEMLQRLREANRLHSGCCSCKTHISRSFHAISL